MTLYTKEISPKGKVTYKEVIEDDFVVVELTDEQCLTAAGTLGVTLLALFERHFKPMKNGTPHLTARKIKAVEEAILDLYKGTGKPVNRDIMDDFCKAWDHTMRAMSA